MAAVELIHEVHADVLTADRFERRARRRERCRNRGSVSGFRGIRDAPVRVDLGRRKSSWQQLLLDRFVSDGVVRRRLSPDCRGRTPAVSSARSRTWESRSGREERHPACRLARAPSSACACGGDRAGASPAQTTSPKLIRRPALHADPSTTRVIGTESPTAIPTVRAHLKLRTCRRVMAIPLRQLELVGGQLGGCRITRTRAHCR